MAGLHIYSMNSLLYNNGLPLTSRECWGGGLLLNDPPPPVARIQRTHGSGQRAL